MSALTLTEPVTKLGIWLPYDYDQEMEPVMTEFRYFLDEPDEVDATFNVYESPLGDGWLIGWDLEMVGLVTWHRAPTYEIAEAWVYEQVEPWCNADYTIPDAAP